ncbi:multiple monosaccharide ABC transporter permease [Actinomycetaceae bacterium MB13-C1-2]|nr:multiple monosaccharide ABC transporter permease [Actinomycetaceae bacterium MB13-C1-2]
MSSEISARAERAAQRKSINLRDYGILAALVLIIVAFSIMTKGTLLDPNNVAALIKQNAYVMVLTIGMTMVIIARHIDLSVGSVVAFVGAVVALCMKDFGINWFLAVLIGLFIGLLIGAWQGFWVAYVGVPAFIVTLGGMLLFRGLAIIVLGGKTIAGLPSQFNDIAGGSFPPFFGYLGQLDVVTLVIGIVAIVAAVYSQVNARIKAVKTGAVVSGTTAFVIQQLAIILGVGFVTWRLALSAGGTPIVLVIIGILVIVYSFIMNRTPFGRHIYAVGGNLKAARLSGINTKRVDFMVFVNMGLLAALAGIITTSRAGSAVATAGNAYELDAIAAAFIGGTAVSGGVGKISGAILGALVMGVLNMGLSILNVDPSWQMAIKGIVVILAVAVDLASRRRTGAVS